MVPGGRMSRCGRMAAALALTAALLFACGGCRTFGPPESVLEEEASVRRAVVALDGAPTFDRTARLSKFELSSKDDFLMRENDAARVRKQFSTSLAALSRFFAEDSGETVTNACGQIEVGVWLGVDAMPRFAPWGPGRQFRCQLVAGYRTAKGDSGLLVNRSFEVNGLKGGPADGFRASAMMREVCQRAAEMVDAALDDRFPLCGKVLWRLDDTSFVIDRGVGDGLRDGDGLVLVAGGREGEPPTMLARATAKAESGYAVLTVVDGVVEDAAAGMPVRSPLPADCGFAAVRYRRSGKGGMVR